MIYKLLRLYWFLSNRDYIPRLPRGMLATDYNENAVSRDQWRVLDRIGARDPAGIKRAMKKYNVDSLEELIALLDHHKPNRRIGERFYYSMVRLSGGHSYKHDPHRDDIKTAFRQQFDNIQYIKIRDRIKKAKNHYDG